MCRRAVGETGDNQVLIKTIPKHGFLFAAAHMLLGNREKAASAVQELLKIDPQLTVSRLHDRVPFATNEPLWKMHSEALRQAGLPE